MTWAVYLSRGAQKKTDRVCTIVAQARAARAPPVRGNERGRDDEQDNGLLEALMAPMPAAVHSRPKALAGRMGPPSKGGRPVSARLFSHERLIGCGQQPRARGETTNDLQVTVSQNGFGRVPDPYRDEEVSMTMQRNRSVVTVEVRYFVTNLPPGSTRDDIPLKLVRAHWAVEDGQMPRPPGSATGAVGYAGSSFAPTSSPGPTVGTTYGRSGGCDRRPSTTAG